MLRTRHLTGWWTIAAAAIVVLGVVLSMGYGLIGIFLVLLLLSMGGGALLYWLDGESEE